MQPKNVPRGFVGPASSVEVCVSTASDTNSTSPEGWGFRRPHSDLKELRDARWHSTTCEESNFVCNFGRDTAEWTVCRVASHFLLKMIGELNAGESKSVAHVKSMLAPYLGGPGGIARVEPVGVPADFTPARAQEALTGLYEELDKSTRQHYEALQIEGDSLSDEVLAALKHDKSGAYLTKDRGPWRRLVPKEVTVQQVLFNVLNNSTWRAYRRPCLGCGSVWLVSGSVWLVALALLAFGAVAWRRRSNLARFRSTSEGRSVVVRV